MKLTQYDERKKCWKRAPVEYKRYFAAEMVQYFEQYLDLAEVNVVGDGEKSEDTIEAERLPVRSLRSYPTFTKYAAKKHCTRQVLWKWAHVDDDKPEFREAYDYCREIQDDVLKDRAIDGRLNPKVFQLLHMGYDDITDSASGSGDSDDDIDINITIREPDKKADAAKTETSGGAVADGAVADGAVADGAVADGAAGGDG